MKLSIITINYNNKNGLERTIKSVQSQTIKTFEWIIIDGGSIDGSKEIILQNQSSFTYWISEPDNGVYHAMNKGIKELTGDYVIFLNSGDYFIDDKVLEYFIKENPLEDIVYGYVEREINGKQMRLEGFLHKTDLTMTDLYYQTIPHQGTFFKTNLFKRFGLYDESLKILADRKFYVNSIIYGNATVRFLPRSIAYFEEGGVSGTEIYEGEKEKVLNELFPPRVYKDILMVKSVREIKDAGYLFSKLYSILYRMSIILRRKSQ